jgi:hypothetical protein
MATSREIEKFLTALKSHKVAFMLVGNSAAALQGAKVVTEDFDVWLPRLDFWQLASIARSLGGFALFTEHHGVQVYLADKTPVDIILSVTGIEPFEKVIKRARQIRLGSALLPVLDLADIIRSKETLGRPKDLRVLSQLKDFLKLRNALEKSRGQRNKPRGN